MVKGNKERRQELARRRKEDKASESERRKGGPESATPVEVRARLLCDAKALGGEEQLVAWVVQAPAEDGVECKAWCEDYFRTSTCQLKRCRNAHEVSISHLSHVPAMPGVGAGLPVATRGRSVSPAARRAARAASEERSSEPAPAGGGGGASGAAPAPAPAARSGGGGYAAVARGRSSGSNLSCVPSAAFFPALQRVPLRSCEAGAKLVYSKLLRTTVRTETPLRFIEWGGRLCFDLANPSVFASYCESAVVSSAAGAGAAAQGAAGDAPAGAGQALEERAERGQAGGSEEEEEEEGEEGGEGEGEEEEEEGEEEEEEEKEEEEEGKRGGKEEAREGRGLPSLRVRFAAVLGTALE